MDWSGPLVSVILTTRDRPRLLSIALACYAHQTYMERELIVVDDGACFPADHDAVAAVNGRLIRVPPGTPLGTKLNIGVQAARGTLCQKMDDDDWYAPHFVETMIATVNSHRDRVCRPAISFLTPFLFFHLVQWEVRRSVDRNFPGATLMFAREDWEEHPFRPLPRDEDVWFFSDQTRYGVAPLPVDAPETFLAVRHGKPGTDRGHTWTHQGDGRSLEEYIQERPLHEVGLEGLLPDWALAVYADLRHDLLQPRAAPQ